MTVTNPDQIHAAWGEACNAGDVESALALYETDAVVRPQPDQILSGQKGVRQALTGFFGLKPKIEIETTNVFEAGDIALLTSSWIAKGSGPDGNEIDMEGSAIEVARRQQDGSWLLVIDNPWGVG